MLKKGHAIANISHDQQLLRFITTAFILRPDCFTGHCHGNTAVKMATSMGNIAIAMETLQ